MAIAAVLAGEPGFLILGEPTVGLDAYCKKLLEDHLKKIVRLDRGIVLVSHDATFVRRVAERVFSLENGRILALI